MRVRLLAASLALLLVGCTGEAPDRSALEPSSGGTVVLALPEDPDVLNPLLYTSAVSGLVLDLMTESLVEMGEDFAYHPHIARDWRYDADGLGITLTLRPWSWSDGTPLTAGDAVASVALYLDPEVASPRAGGRIANILSVEAPDDSTLHYRFRAHRSDLLPTLGHHLLPSHLTRGLKPAEVRSWPLNEAPLASGPFVLERWDHNDRIVLRRNRYYRGPQPLIERVVLRIIPDGTARTVELETGGIDVLDDVPPHQVPRLAASPDLVLEHEVGRLTGQITWNLERDLFDDVRVRRALSLAIDREYLVETLLAGYGRAAAGPLPPAVWAYDAALIPDPHDPAQARRLLDAAGWRDRDGDGVRERDGVPLRFELITRKGDPVRENAAVALRGFLADVGAEVVPRVMEFNAAIDRVQDGDFDAYLGVYSSRLVVDPSPLLGGRPPGGLNYGHYASERADSLLARALAEEDRVLASGLWTEYQRVVVEEAPLAFLYHPDVLVAHSRRVQDVRPHVLSPYNNIQEWWIAPQDRKYRRAE